MKSGFLLIDKPIGPSSFGIIRQLRRQLQIKKMGHAGTLDPMASGLLVVAVGEATKLLSFLDTGAKEYIFEIQFGETRNTGDSEGEVLEDGFSFPSEEEIVAVYHSFVERSSRLLPSTLLSRLMVKRRINWLVKGKR